MSAEPSDKKTYSVDEMLDSLRDGEREKEGERELVTREDGSQAIKVKKRKRRSKQKKEEEAKRRKRLTVVRTLLIIMVPLFLGLGILLLVARYHSSGFAESVTATIWQRSGAQAKVSRLSPMGTQVTAQTLTLAWPDGGSLDQMKATKVKGDLNLISFLTGKLRGAELGSGQGYLITSGREDRKVRQPRGEPAAIPGFERYSSDQFAFYFGSAKSPFRLEETKVRFTPTEYSRRLSVTGGDLYAGSWGVMPLKRGTLEFLNNTIKVVSLRFEEKNRHLVLSGDLGLADEIHSLTLEAREATLGAVAGLGIDKLITSQIDGATGTLVFRPWSIESHEVTLSCAPEYLKIHDFAFLDVLEELYGDSRFKDFEFEVENPFELIRNTKGTTITSLDVMDVGFLALQGEVQIQGEALSGRLRVGLPDHKRINLRSDQRVDFFAKGTLERGFFWFDVELSGTPQAPKDNFLKLLEGGAGKASAEDLFDQLTR